MDKGKAQQQGNFLTGRQIARMICKNFRIIGESEAILEVGELMKVQIINDNAQSVDTRSDEVLSAFTERLGEHMENSVQVAARHSVKLGYVMLVYSEGTVLCGERGDYDKLK